VTYYPPAVLPLRREEVVTGPLDGAEVFTAPVVAPTLTVWIQVVQDAHGRRHRSPARAELAGGLHTGSDEHRRRWADALAHHGARVMATLRAAGRQERELTWARSFEAADAAADPDGVWGRFVVELAGPELALALLRPAGRAPSGER
jgi:hypothetical protein